jgi:transposase
MVKCTKKQIRELKAALRWKMPAAQRERIQMVLLRESGMTQPTIAEAMGVSLSTVNRAHMAYDGGGIKALKPQPIGGRQRENLHEVVVETRTEERDDGSPIIIVKSKFKLADKRSPLVDLGKHLGLFKERVEHTGKDDGPIEVKSYTDIEVARLIGRMLTKVAGASPLQAGEAGDIAD